VPVVVVGTVVQVPVVVVVVGEEVQVPAVVVVEGAAVQVLVALDGRVVDMGTVVDVVPLTGMDVLLLLLSSA